MFLNIDTFSKYFVFSQTIMNDIRIFYLILFYVIIHNLYLTLATIMKKILLLSSFFLFFVFYIAMSQTATPPSAGDGSEGDPYQIATLENLYWLSQNPSEWDKVYIQTADIDASATSGWNGGNGFSPIGDGTTSFSGFYHGQGHIIDSLYINNTSSNYSGLFGHMDHAGVDSLGVTHARVSSGQYYTACLAGYLFYSSATHCYTTGEVSGDYATGGLVGMMYESHVSGCYSEADINGSGDYAGGLVGYSEHYSTIRDCYSTGNVTSTGKNTGGLAGESRYHCLVEQCYSTGNVSGGDQNTGGLIGNDNEANVSNCYSAGDVTGADRTGGLIGHVFNGSLINACYSRGHVSGTTDTGGLIGLNENGTSPVDNSFWDTQTSGLTTSGGGTGKITAEMTSLQTYTDTATTGLTEAWDFAGTPYDDINTEDIWVLGGSEGYPVFITGDSLYSLVTSDSITDVENTLAEAHGFIQFLNPVASSTYGFCWNTTENPNISDPKTTLGPASGTGAFVTTLTGLQTGTRYYARAYITNKYGTSYGKDISFIPGTPTVRTVKVSHITDNTALGEGDITILGATNPTAYGFCWNSTGDPDITDNKTDEGTVSNTGTFTTVLTGLAPNGIYYARAYVTNTYGTTYGRVIKFQKTPPPAGSGTEADPYRIKTLGNLRWLMENADQWDKYFIQTADIDALETDTWDHNNGFSPIGYSAYGHNGFKGNYNGKGHTITGLFIDHPDQVYTGLFGYLDGATVDSLHLTGVRITGKEYTGGLDGFGYYATVRHCSSSGNVQGNGNRTGGLLGAANFSTVDRCCSRDTVTSSGDNTGGLLGESYHTKIFNSCFEGLVTGHSYTGGLTGKVTGALVDNSYSRGRVQASGYYAGGLVGAGGTLQNCYSRAHVTGTAIYVGGLAGESTADRCYSTGAVAGNGSVGGLMGIGSTATSSFWDTLTSGISVSAAGTPKCTTDMKDYRTFTDLNMPGLDSAWDFSGHFFNDTGTLDIWSLGAGNDGYLSLFWEDSLFTIVSIDSLRDITPTSATAHGTLISLGSDTPVSHGFCWNTTGSPDLTGDHKDLGPVQETGPFSASIEGLTAGTVYYIRAFATNPFGTFYGNEITLIAGGALVTSDSITDITAHTALGHGNITDLGAEDPVAYGFCWNKKGDPDLSDPHSNEGAADHTGTFSSLITGLFPGTIYHARAYVTNGYGTYYGKEFSFVYAPAPAGSGTDGDPYRIQELGNLRWMIQHPEHWDKVYIQVADINAASTAGWDADSGYIPVGNAVLPFTGKYHGQGHHIDSLTILRPHTDYTGFFGYANNAVIDSLGLTDVDITGNNNTGALSGRNDNTTIGYCYATGNISGNSQSGGLVGWNNASSVISYCNSRGNVHGLNSSIGGLVGYNYNATIRYSYSNTLVENSVYSGNLGGLVGNNRNSVVSDCYALGSVKGNAYVGGFAGFNLNGSVIRNCYSAGEVTGNDITGGFVGSNSNATISNCFWDKESSGQTTGPAATGKTTEEMKDFHTFTDTSVTGLDESWDFVGTLGDDTGTEDIWGINAGNRGYLSLTWQDSLLAIITSDSLTDITTTSLKGKGNILYLSPEQVTSYGYCWDKTGNPDISGDKSDEGVANSTGSFTTDISGLTEGETYYLRAYVTNSYGTYYGQTLSFTAGGGFITTDSITQITDTTVTGYGNVIALGATHPTAYGFCWNMTGQPDISDQRSDEGSLDHTGVFSTVMKGLQSGNRYYFRAYVTNASGTSYGEEIVRVLTIPPQGSGTSADPYRITSLGNLRWLSRHPETWNKYFIQTRDIDAHTTSTWNDGQGFSPIGNEQVSFSGTYDGQGHTISGLTIRQPETDHVGFLGNVSNGNIKYLGIVEADITGHDMTGALAGNIANSASIAFCFTTGKVTGTGNQTGGLTGYAYNYVNIDNCYSQADVSGTGNTGGLVGWNRKHCTIQYCYSTGKVTATGTSGGLVGSNEWSSSVSNSFWDVQTSGMITSSGGTGKTTEELGDPETFTDLATAGLDHAWDLVGNIHDDAGNADIWGYRPGNNGYLCLSWQDSLLAVISTGDVDIANETSATVNGEVLYAGTPAPTAHGVCWNTTGTPTLSDNTTDEGTVNSTGPFSSNITGLSVQEFYFVRAYITNDYGTYYGNTHVFSTSVPKGSGTAEDPYRIACLGDLLWLTQHSEAWDKYFIQTADISAALTSQWNGGKGLQPVGNSNIHFTGHYNGKGHIVDSLYINRPGVDNIALFGYLQNAGIDSLGLTSANISGGGYTAALAGQSDQSSYVFACFTTGRVSGKDNVGGITGSNINSSTISNCYSRTEITGNDITGGLVGNNNGGKIDHSYSTGSITRTGGTAGGLAGYSNPNYYVTQSFWDTITAGIAAGAGYGKTTAEMKNLCTYVDGTEATWDFMGETDNGTEDLWGMNAAKNDGYPFLSWQGYTHTETCCNIDTTVTVNGITLTANATGNVSYQWVNCNNGNANIPGETNQSFTATANGSYAVIITSPSCSATSSCHTITTVGINDQVLGKSVRLYPNPARDHLFVECNGIQIQRIEIMDFTGKVIGQIRMNGQQAAIDLTGKVKGFYLIKLITNKGTIIKKIIKE